MAEKRYEIGSPKRSVTIHESFGVYKDYDGNVHDGPVFAVCATQDLADQVAQILEALDPTRGDDAEDEIADNIANLPADLRDLAAAAKTDGDGIIWPFVEGHEHSSKWSVSAGESEASDIACSLSEAIAQVMTANQS
jgi:hypothetical protein